MSRYDAHRGYTPASAQDRPRLMNFMLPWAAGIVVTLVTQLVLAVLVWDVITGDDVSTMASPVRTVLLLHLPSAACVALGVWAAARPCTRARHGSHRYGTSSRRSPPSSPSSW
ncbi:hypothetical protein [Streptomyces poriferorum]|uniref:hypothetical protein n=1 Tax=Streptomyces poriferorum TaxID=2798799 RepID=UPI001C5EB5A8|nr:hypothetical protein [Streptomyces poriferorum]MBW5258211.1 hypothetical protein [Streptomyces poriferorum]